MRKIILVLCSATILMLLVYTFYHKTYINNDLVFQSLNKNEKNYPDAYEFFHSKEEIEHYFYRNKHTKDIKIKCRDIVFDFKNYSYVIFDGHRVKKIFYSYKTTFFDDISPSYAKPKGKKPVFVEYEDDKSEKGIFIYKVKKDISLRGFYGV